MVVPVKFPLKGKTLALQQAGEKIFLRLSRVLLLRYQAELSLEEISTELDIPVDTVKSRLHRARHKLYEQVFRLPGRQKALKSG